MKKEADPAKPARPPATNSRLHGPCDLETLYIRNVPQIYSRDIKVFQARDMYKLLYFRPAEAGVKHAELKALIQAAQDNPNAEQTVYHVLTVDPNVEKVTEGLIHD